MSVRLAKKVLSVSKSSFALLFRRAMSRVRSVGLPGAVADRRRKALGRGAEDVEMVELGLTELVGANSWPWPDELDSDVVSSDDCERFVGLEGTEAAVETFFDIEGKYTLPTVSLCTVLTLSCGGRS